MIYVLTAVVHFAFLIGISVYKSREAKMHEDFTVSVEWTTPRLR